VTLDLGYQVHQHYFVLLSPDPLTANRLLHPDRSYHNAACRLQARRAPAGVAVALAVDTKVHEVCRIHYSAVDIICC